MRLTEEHAFLDRLRFVNSDAVENELFELSRIRAGEKTFAEPPSNSS